MGREHFLDWAPRLACLAVLLVTQAAATAQSTRTATTTTTTAPTCAILADATAGLDSSPVVALLEAKLSQDSRVRLLERAEITRILAEHSLSLSLAESTPKSRREWGQVLRAQMLVLLQTRQVKEGKVIEASFVETRHGLSLGNERLVWGDRAEQIASLLARRISQVAGTATADLKYVFAVPPFEAEDLSPDSLQYQSAYAQLVEETLSHLPGVVMADLAHAAEVARELAVSEGETSVARSLPYYLHGRHKMTGPTGNRTVSFHLELRHGQDIIASLNKDAVRPADAASFLRETCTDMAHKVIGGALQAPVNGATTLEADLLEERCRAYRLVGEWESSIRMAETALLLDPGRNELRAQLLYLYERLVWVWNGRRFRWETEFRRKQDADMRKRIATRPYDTDAEPIPVRAFVQCGFAAINHAWHLAHERPLRREEVWPLCNLVSTASRPFNSPDIYDWKQDASSLTPLMRGLLDQYSDVCSYVLSNSRISEDQNRSAYTYMASSVCKLASSSPWIGREGQLDVLRRCLLAIEPADGSFAIQWDVASSASHMLWSAPEPARVQFFLDLSRREAGSTRFIVD
ncbi:MAG: hypothetical protein GX616_17445, partial [Planctomycetes bacterium]|nr:hypothetical protein [Planctomycetota bacterium]